MGILETVQANTTGMSPAWAALAEARQLEMEFREKKLRLLEETVKEYEAAYPVDFLDEGAAHGPVQKQLLYYKNNLVILSERQLNPDKLLLQKLDACQWFLERVADQPLPPKSSKHVISQNAPTKYSQRELDRIRDLAGGCNGDCKEWKLAESEVHGKEGNNQ